MLEQITIERFKSLAHVDLSVGQLNLFVGTNASGKSNLFDALRVLQGVGYGLTVSEIFDGKPKSAASVVWDCIRGGSKEAVLRLPVPRRGPNPQKNTCRFALRFTTDEAEYVYEIGLNPLIGAVRHESLSVNGKPIFSTEKTSEQHPTLTARVHKGEAGQPPRRDFEKQRSILHQLLRDNNLPPERHAMLETCIAQLSDLQRLDLIPAQLRQYSRVQSAQRLGERGEDFAALVKTLCAKKTVKAEYLSWLQELTPSEVDDVKILKGAIGELLFALKEGKAEYPAQVLSDGTLRFAALAAALFQPDMPGLILLEEIENGIHPTRLRLLVELLRSRTGDGGPQILATTHSPVVLAWLTEADYAHTFFCSRDADGLSVIRPLTQIPQFNDIIGRTPLSGLFAEGWLETAL